tara:strand:+ start:602 stop:787 length:186 start_codon:yes stop_codon:yes gene_type:complete
MLSQVLPENNETPCCVDSRAIYDRVCHSYDYAGVEVLQQSLSINFRFELNILLNFFIFNIF